MIKAPDYWLPYIPAYTSQYSVATATDSESCVSHSIVAILEMLLGNRFRFSPRAVAYFSATTIEGNTLANVLDSVNKVGLIPYALWPTPDHFTWAEYYTPVPKEIWQQAIKVDVSMIPADILKSPLWTILDFGTNNHVVAQLTINKPHNLYFDSETGDPVKTIYQPTVSQHSLKINKFNMTNAEFVHKAGTSEYGFYLPATSEESIKDKALNLGLSITKPDNTVDFSQAKEVTGL